MKEAVYKNYLLTVLAAILAFNYVDRTILGLALQNIKVDLSLSDTQLGFLTGIAFAFFYAVMGIPIARWADRGNRVTIISLTTALWSVAVTLCGVAGNFTQLLLIRVGVAVGEAGCIPPAHSLIPDYFTRAERPRAVARYLLGGPLSSIVGFFCAGWLNELYGWRATFMLLGLPGLALAALARFTLREPRHGILTKEAASADRPQEADGTVSTPCMPGPENAAFPPDRPNLKEVCVSLWDNRTFRNVLFCLSVCAFFNAGIVQWLPVFFIRSYGLKTGELGTWFAVIYGLGGLLGIYCGGELASRRAANNERLQLKAIAIAYSILGALNVIVYLSTNRYLAFACLALAGVGGAAANGPLFATVQSLVPDRMRAMSIALIYLLSNLIGMGLGPLAVGALSDAFNLWFGDKSLRYALLAMCPGYLWGAWHLFLASKTVTRDLESMEINRSLGVLNYESST
jgi:MFS family permease